MVLKDATCGTILLANIQNGTNHEARRLLGQQPVVIDKDVPLPKSSRGPMKISLSVGPRRQAPVVVSKGDPLRRWVGSAANHLQSILGGREMIREAEVEEERRGAGSQ